MVQNLIYVSQQAIAFSHELGSKCSLFYDELVQIASITSDTNLRLVLHTGVFFLRDHGILCLVQM